MGFRCGAWVWGLDVSVGMGDIWYVDSACSFGMGFWFYVQGLGLGLGHVPFGWGLDISLGPGAGYAPSHHLWPEQLA